MLKTVILKYHDSDGYMGTWGRSTTNGSVPPQCCEYLGFRKDSKVLVGIVRINKTWSAQKSWSP